jgi:hypothetical protein
MEQTEALAQYKKLVKDKPEEKDQARKSFYDHFQVDPESATFSKPKLTDFQKTAARHKVDIGVEQTKATYKQDVSNAESKFIGDVATAIPVAATLATTGGMAAPVAAAVMGAAGGAAGGYAEAAKLALGADTAVSSPKQLARRLGVDVALGAGTQAAATLGSNLLAAGGQKLLEPLVARAAAKVDAGKTILGTYGGKILNQLRSVDAAAGTPKISIQGELNDLDAALALRKTGPSDAFKKLWSGGDAENKGLASKIAAWAERDGSASGLTEIKGELSQAAFKRAGLNHEEQSALKAFAGKVDQKLSQTFNEIGGGELYHGYKETVNQLHRFSAGVEGAGLALRHMAWRAGYMTMGAGYGGVSGYEHGGIAGAVGGAVAGAALITGASALVQKGSPWLLERILADKAAAPLAQKAIAGMMAGDTKGATAIFARAASQVGADKVLKSWMQDEAEKQAPKMGSVVNQNQEGKAP